MPPVKPILQLAEPDPGVLPPGPLHLAIGMFDGVHLGHRAVIEPAVHAARREGGVSAVLTFRPHPTALFRPEHPTRLILDSPSQAELLEGLGVDAVITQRFDRAFAAIRAEDFVGWLKRRLPSLAGIHVGQNFRFGAGRLGDVAVLVAAARPFGVTVFSVPAVRVDGEPVNSTRVRTLLAAGEVAAAAVLLGQPYFARGAVIAGRRLGRQLGFPTLNLAWEPDLRPRFGVYAVDVKDGRREAPAGPSAPGVANYGLRPTVEAREPEPRLEVHLFGECRFDTGDEILVEWRRFLRPEMKFASLDALRAQIARDVAAARSR